MQEDHVILQRLSVLEQHLEDLKKRWPAHSVKPQMIEEMEEVEEQIDALRDLYKSLNANKKEGGGK